MRSVRRTRDADGRARLQQCHHRCVVTMTTCVVEGTATVGLTGCG
jgi:hypothetical protein